MRKGFIIDLQQGINWNGNYNFADNSEGSEYYMPGSGSFPFDRKVRIGDIWKVDILNSAEISLVGTNDLIAVSPKDFLIAIGTGSDGYVSRKSASHWEIHKANPGGGNGILYTSSSNTYSVNPKTDYGLAIDTLGVAISGSNITSKETVSNTDEFIFVTGSNGRPYKITYEHLISEISSDTSTKFANQYKVLDYKLTANAANEYNNNSSLTVLWTFNSVVELAPYTDFHAAISNLYLKVSGSDSLMNNTDYEIETYIPLELTDSEVAFKLSNLNFKPEENDILQVFCFLSGSGTAISSRAITEGGPDLD